MNEKTDEAYLWADELIKFGASRYCGEIVRGVRLQQMFEHYEDN